MMMSLGLDLVRFPDPLIEKSELGNLTRLDSAIKATTKTRI